ncbi:MAG: hypothetical protein CSA95_06560 [Bacteroidetes bacterium]|nr:MAG: hypothetical protein CSA95_06560 [Bacteroidota bacterium]PIE87937.1 MAG: hypothetical protein CSA04_04470 [Bacteroidota bacterium]
MLKRIFTKQFFLATLACLLYPTILRAQDLENLAKSDPFDYSGSLNLSLSHYHSKLGQNLSVPWQYAISANVTPSLYGIQLPINIYLNNYQRGINHPFNFYGISPSFKWAKLHLGHSSMTFSPFTLSGQTFWGVGVELTPGFLRFSALYGKFRNYAYLPHDDVTKTSLIPSYKRKGYGLKIGVGSDDTHVDFIYFKAKDDEELISRELDSLRLTPKENAVIGLNARMTLFKKLRFHLNSALSLLSRNTLERSLTIPDEYSFITTFIEPNLTTTLGIAGDAGVHLFLRGFTLGLNYKRIDPDYRSLGSSYFLNDLESVTIDNSFTAFNQRLMIKSSLGLGRNNLRSDKTATSTKIIGSVNAHIRFHKSIQLQVLYNNFVMDQQLKIVDINDTLQYSQNNQIFRIAPVSTWGNEQFRHRLTSSFVQSGFTTQHGSSLEETNVHSTAVNLAYYLHLKEDNLSINTGTFWRKYEIAETRQSNRLGFNLGGNKTFFDKKFTANASYTFSTGIGGEADSSISHFSRASLSYKVTPKQNISLSFNYIRKTTGSELRISDTRVFLHYSFTLK